MALRKLHVYIFSTNWEKSKIREILSTPVGPKRVISKTIFAPKNILGQVNILSQKANYDRQTYRRTDGKKSQCKL